MNPPAAQRFDVMKRFPAVNVTPCIVRLSLRRPRRRRHEIERDDDDGYQLVKRDCRERMLVSNIRREALLDACKASGLGGLQF